MKQTKSTEPKAPSNKGREFKNFMVALVVIVVMVSVSYTAFITAVGVGGKTNLYLAAPSIVAIFAIIIVAVYHAVRSFNNK